MTVGSEPQPRHGGHAPVVSVTITVSGQRDWDLWPGGTWLFHLSNYTSGDDSQSFNHCIDSSMASLGVHATAFPCHHLSTWHTQHIHISLFFNHLLWHTWHPVCAHTQPTQAGSIPLPTGAHWFLTPVTPGCKLHSTASFTAPTRQQDQPRTTTPHYRHTKTPPCWFFFFFFPLFTGAQLSFLLWATSNIMM